MKNVVTTDSKHRFLGSFIITFGVILVWYHYGTFLETSLSLKNLESNSHEGELPRGSHGLRGP